MFHHNMINGKGKNLQSTLTRQVNGRNWRKGRHHVFFAKGKRNPAFIVSPKPTSKQPGNGLIYFRQKNGCYKPSRYDELRRTIKDPRFRNKHKNFNKTNASKLNYRSKSAQANVLLLFESSRRRGNYFPKIKVQRGIKKVMTSSKKNYPEQANRMLGMFKGSKNAREKNYKGIMRKQQSRLPPIRLRQYL